MTIDEFLKKVNDADCTYLDRITPEFEGYLKEYSDVEITPGEIIINKKGSERYIKNPCKMKFIK